MLSGSFRKTSKTDRSESGQALVEFALTLPVLLLFICGIIDFGWIYVNNYRLEHAAYSGARYVTIYASGDMSDSELERNVKTAVSNNLPDGDPDHVSLSINKAQKQVTINITYPVKTITFVAGTIWGSYYNASLSNTAYY